MGMLNDCGLILMADIKSSCLPKPTMEFRFHPTRRWRADYAWPDYMLLLEIEGGVFNNGRHVRGVGYENDCVKYNSAIMMGYTLLRFTTSQVKSGYAIELLKEFFTNTPHPVMGEMEDLQENEDLVQENKIS